MDRFLSRAKKNCRYNLCKHDKYKLCEPKCNDITCKGYYINDINANNSIEWNNYKLKTNSKYY